MYLRIIVTIIRRKFIIIVLYNILQMLVLLYGHIARYSYDTFIIK